ncbi:MAG TPA: tetratricopeptide repeat protein [Rhizomicrobium sp.]|jgi:hypothetical protein
MKANRIRGRLAQDSKPGRFAGAALIFLGCIAMFGAPMLPIAANAAAATPVQAAARECDRLAAAPVPMAPNAAAGPGRIVDWNEAIRACTLAADANPKEPRYQFELGRSYELNKNYFDAALHYRFAADAGSSHAQRALGVAYYKGLGVVQNRQTAFELFSRAAAAGNPYAMANLGAMYGNGDFVNRNDAEALEWFEKAIEAGDAEALGQVGIAYFYGRGTPVDHRMAAQYFRQSADLGDGYSLKFLAIMYERGMLGAPDQAKAVQLRQRAEQVDPGGDSPAVPVQSRTRNAARGRAATGGGPDCAGNAYANNQFYTGSVCVSRWHGIATHLPRCWPICSVK